jgi:hypothetical protein
VTIRKGEEWGVLAVPPAGLVTVTGDAELHDLLAAGHPAGEPVGLLGGDLMRTVGGSGDAARLRDGRPVPHLPIDLVRVRRDDGAVATAVAHVVARRPAWQGGWWRGPVTALMNAQFHGGYDVAPRSHPNDGKVDLIAASATMPVGQRRLARRRMPLGTHVPHPEITVRQLSAGEVDLGGSCHLWVDGRPWGSATALAVEVLPDAATVCV